MSTLLWQVETLHRFSTFFESNPAVKALILVGSNTNATIDRWSDVDFVCVIDDGHLSQFFPNTQWLAAFGDILGLEQSSSTFSLVTRVCFVDFRRVDLVFVPESNLNRPENWHYFALESQVIFSRSAVVDAALQSAPIPQRLGPAFDNQQFERMAYQFWFKAGIAATKVMRNDLLIGLHLALDLARDCLVLGMIMRDVEVGTTVHRYGGPYNELVEHIALTGFRPTSEGILDLVLQNALTFDALASRWSATYRCKAEIFRDWIHYLHSLLSV